MYAYTCYKIEFYVQKLEQNYVQWVSSTNVPLQLQFKDHSIGMPSIMEWPMVFFAQLAIGWNVLVV